VTNARPTHLMRGFSIQSYRVVVGSGGVVRGRARTPLERACHDILGMGPKWFLLLWRFNLARRAVVEDAMSDTRVAAIALKMGASDAAISKHDDAIRRDRNLRRGVVFLTSLLNSLRRG
jgi:hypothetical protein